ncbi:hypothetical protein [Sediminicola sp. 1XM1-17]|uniref:hypothetical protein n=1 Tax=Sediminicola sp. 1XM1-17 TaxID=3127702 RepID=UPI0030771F3E
MNRYKIIILALIFSTPIYSQINSSKVAFVSYWSIGDSYDFNVSKIKQKWKDGNLTKDEHQNYIANFTVLDSTDKSYTINWSYEVDLGSTYKIPEKLVEKFSKYKLNKIIYKTTELGEFIEILNWKEVGDIMNNMFDDLITFQGEENGKQIDALKTAMQPLKQIYSSKQGIEQLVVKELQYFHQLMGLEYDISEPIIYEESLPNMFGGNPIKAQAKLYFENVDFTESYCTVKQELSMDPEDTKELLNQLFVLMKLDDKEIGRALETAVFKVEDRNTYEFYYNPGIPHKIETIRETVVDIEREKARSLDKTIIELIYYN